MATRYDLTVRALDVVGVAGVVTVTCQLCDSDHDPVVGYTDDGEIVDRYSGYTDSDGELTLELVANASITPANTYYSLRVGSRRFLIEKGASTQTVQQALAGSPAELASALTLDQLADVDAGSPTDGQVLSWDDDAEEWVPASLSSDPAMGGDLSGTASNAQIVAGAVGTTEIANGAVTAAKVAADVATQAELDAVDGAKLAKASNLSDVADAATAFAAIKQAATTDATGVVELATAAEVMTGTDTSRAVTPAGYAQGYGVRHAMPYFPLYYAAPGVLAASNAFVNMAGGGYESWCPIWLEAGVYDRIAVASTVAAVSTWRLGLDSSPAGGFRPATNILDAGTVDMNAAPGFQQITINLTVSTPGWYWGRVKCDAYTAAPTVVVVSGVGAVQAVDVLGWPANDQQTQRHYVGLVRPNASGTGSLPDPPGITTNPSTGLGYSQAAIRVFLRRAS